MCAPLVISSLTSSPINKKSGIQQGLDTIDNFVEFYMKCIIKPALVFHEVFYSWLNTIIRSCLDLFSDYIPEWFTANFITYIRTFLVIPCLLLLAQGYQVVPSIIVMSVDFGDFLDGVVARYWVDIKKSRDDIKETCIKNEMEFDKSSAPQFLSSWSLDYHDRTYGGFIDMICDKIFVAPCWIILLSTVESSGFMKLFHFLTLVLLICGEAVSGFASVKAFYKGSGFAVAKVEGINFSYSSLKADHIGKVKQTFHMVGTALFILPRCKTTGLVFLSLSLPLVYAIVRGKLASRVMYVQASCGFADYKSQRLWKQAKGLGSILIVGVPWENDTASTLLNVSASDSVDYVMRNSPKKVSLQFLDAIGADFMVCLPSHTSMITEEVVVAKRCLVIGNDFVVHPMESKAQ
jgi:phosphatidylglycerophosphate synthase